MKKVLIVVIAVLVLQLGVVSASYASGNGGNSYHRVHYGETLFSIGRLYNVHPYHIAQVNGLSNPNKIYAGQVLYIPSGSTYPWPCGGGGQDCGGWDGGCGNNCGWQDSGWDGGCGNNCGWQDSGWQGGCGNNCGGWDGGGQGNCGGNNCGGYYGYDYTGYYYGNQNQRYSHTCGYYSNCW